MHLPDTVTPFFKKVWNIDATLMTLGALGLVVLHTSQTRPSDEYTPDAVLTNARSLVAWNPDRGASPVVDAANVTTELQALLTGGVPKFLGHQTAGNGSNGPSIRLSTLELTWQA